MNKHSVALILPYYGKFPNYFPLWLKSAGANPSFTFMIFTDIDMSGYNIPGNVKVYRMTFDEVKKLIAPHLDFDFVCDTPYKLCDYRPMFGLIFQDYIDGYDFWGFCDSDVIFGDMGKYITDDLLDKYGKIFHNGHLQLFRNTEDVRRFALHQLHSWNISYRDIFTTQRHMFFEEFALCENLFSTFTYRWGGNITHLSSLTFSPSLKSSDVSTAAESFLPSDGKTERYLLSLLTAIPALMSSTCTCIFRRGP